MAVGGATVRVEGLREVQRAFRKMSGELNPALRTALREAAWPVARTVREYEGKWTGASVKTIGPKTTLMGASVTQRARKVTGRRPDFGALQMRQAFIPALEDHAEDIQHAAEHVLDVIVNTY